MNAIGVRKQKELDAKVLSLRSVIIQTAREELGDKITDPISEAEAIRMIEAAGERNDVPGTVALFKKRIALSAKVSQIDKLRDEAEAAGAALTTFNEQEAERLRIVREKRPALIEAGRLATQAYVAAVEAEATLLSTAAESAEERELAEQQTALSQTITRCKWLLSRNTAESHVVMVEQTRNALRSAPKGFPQKQRTELETRLAFHERAVVDRTQELADAEKQIATIQAKLKKLSLEKLKPENFAMVQRRKPVSESRELLAAY